MTHNMTLHMSVEMADILIQIAKQEDATPSEVIRDAIRRDLRRRLNSATTKEVYAVPDQALPDSAYRSETSAFQRL